MEKALLVLDLDETLIYGTKKALIHDADFRVGVYHVYLRPNCIEFLIEMSNHYKLAIWSSAGYDYVNEISKYFINQNIEFEFTWSRIQATTKRSKFTEINFIESLDTHHFYVKKLVKVVKKGFNLKRTLILDDSPHKSSENYGNAIYPTIFIGDPKDNELENLKKYLISIKDVQNYRSLEKRFWRDKFK